jgi:hypothetical protein
VVERVFSSGNLDTWGWIYLIVGALVFLAGIMVFFRLRLLLDLFAVLAGAFLIIALDSLVIYALSNPATEEYV